MKTLELTEEEQRLLSGTLERSLRVLEIEVIHTDSHEFKQMLKQRKAVMDQLYSKVQSVAAPA